MLHMLPANKKTVHWGYFDCSLAPALRIQSGDLMRVEAVTHYAGDAPARKCTPARKSDRLRKRLIRPQ